MDEMFETLTLVQTGKMKRFPCVAMGMDFWQPMMEFVIDSMHREGTVTPGEINVETSDSPIHVANYIRDQIHLAQ